MLLYRRTYQPPCALSRLFGGSGEGVYHGPAMRKTHGILLHKNDRPVGPVFFSCHLPFVMKDISGPASHILPFESIRRIAEEIDRGKQSGRAGDYRWEAIDHPAGENLTRKSGAVKKSGRRF